MHKVGVLTRRQYATMVDATDTLQGGAVKDAMTQMLGCIATYRVICHHVAPLLHAAIAECDDMQEKAHLQSLLDDLKRGES